MPELPEGRTAPGRWQRLRRLAAGRRRTPWINGGLAALLALAVTGAFLIIGNPSAPPTPVRTAVVTRGDVTATVTGTGNTDSQLSTPVSFLTDGTVTEVDVKPGDTVTAGQVLADVDPAPSRLNLRTAQAAYDGALAAYQQAASGPTAIKRQQDQQAIAEAQQGVDNARVQLANDQSSTDTSIRTARVQLGTDTTSENTAVSNARTNASAACNGVVLQAFAAPLTTAPSATTTRTTTTAPTSAPVVTTTTAPTTVPTTVPTTTSRPTTTTTAPTGTSTTTSTGAGSCTTAKQDVENAENTRDQVIQKDQLAITSAQQSRTATLDKDQQAITTAQGQVRDAQLTAQADLQPQTPDQIAQARSNVDSAQVSVDTARRALDGTVLKAPQAGVVLAVNGKVGEASGSGSGSASSSSTGSTTTGSGSSSNASSATAAQDAAGTGFITIANPSRLAVTADIAEADAAGLQLGQQATVSFPATNGSATGTVTQITPQSTTTNNVVLYPVVVALDSAPPGIKVGATASLSITDGSATGVLQVPTAAITTVGTNHTVTVQRGGGDDVVVPVGVGLTGATTTEITSGLAAGDVVVLPTAAPATSTAPGAGFPRLGGGGR